MKNIVLELCNGWARPFLCLDEASQRFYGNLKCELPDVRKALICHALFGRSLYISDRYLLRQATARSMLRKEQSLLREMLRTGFAWLVTSSLTCNDCVKLPQQWLDRNDANLEQLKECWSRISRHAFKTKKVANWPRLRQAQGFSTKLKGSSESLSTEVLFQRYRSEQFLRMTDVSYLRNLPGRQRMYGQRQRKLKQQFGMASRSNASIARLPDAIATWGHASAIRNDLGTPYSDIVSAEPSTDQLGDLPLLITPHCNDSTVLKTLVNPSSRAYCIKRDLATGLIDELFSHVTPIEELTSSIKRRVENYAYTLTKIFKTDIFQHSASDSRTLAPNNDMPILWREIAPCILAWRSD